MNSIQLVNYTFRIESTSSKSNNLYFFFTTIYNKSVAKLILIHDNLVDSFSFYNSKNQFYTCRDSAKNLLNENIEQLNFLMEPAQSIDHINRFVEEVTKNNIKNVVQLNPDTRYTYLAIINAASFEGDWVCEVLFLCEKTL